jgi:hypothetical protein
MRSIKKVKIQDLLVSVEQYAYILNGKTQSVYKYFIDDILVLTYYTNGQSTILYPVYYKLDTWPKIKIDNLLASILPDNNSNHSASIMNS